MGTVIEPVPVTGLAANFSPMPRIAPPPFGREICGALTRNVSAGDSVPGLGLSRAAVNPSFGMLRENEARILPHFTRLVNRTDALA